MKPFRIAVLSSLFALSAAVVACSPDPVPVSGEDGCNEQNAPVYAIDSDAGQAHYADIPDAGSAD